MVINRMYKNFILPLVVSMSFSSAFVGCKSREDEHVNISGQIINNNEEVKLEKNLNADKKKPNILMIMGDQWRADWLSAAGTDYVNTPNIDVIVRDGIRFTRGICNSPLCAPSRISMASGLYPDRLGAYDNKALYPIKQPTFYQALKNNGYRVSVIGKSDLHKSQTYFGEDGKGDSPLMRELGFTDSWETIGKEGVGAYAKVFFEDKELASQYGAEYNKRRKKLPAWYSDPAIVPTELYHDSYIGRKAVELINRFEDETPEKPWHLFVSFVGPHHPWDAPQEYYDKYKDKQFSQSIQGSLEDKPVWVRSRAMKESKNMTPRDLEEVKRHYAGMTTLIDDCVGNIYKTLKERGIIDNTIIIITADHGEMMGDFGMFHKSTMYEGALRVPFVISYPGMPARGDSDALAELIDMYPTILDAAGISYDSSNLDGKSLLPILLGKADTHKDYQYSVIKGVRMVFDGQYKYIVSQNDISELYDLKNDPKELYNIIKQRPDITERMENKMKEFTANAIADQNTGLRSDDDK